MLNPAGVDPARGFQYGQQAGNAGFPLVGTLQNGMRGTQMPSLRDGIGGLQAASNVQQQGGRFPGGPLPGNPGNLQLGQYAAQQNQGAGRGPYNAAAQLPNGGAAGQIQAAGLGLTAMQRPNAAAPNRGLGNLGLGGGGGAQGAPGGPGGGLGPQNYQMQAALQQAQQAQAQQAAHQQQQQQQQAAAAQQQQQQQANATQRAVLNQQLSSMGQLTAAGLQLQNARLGLGQGVGGPGGMNLLQPQGLNGAGGGAGGGNPSVDLLSLLNKQQQRQQQQNQQQGLAGGGGAGAYNTGLLGGLGGAAANNAYGNATLAQQLGAQAAQQQQAQQAAQQQAHQHQAHQAAVQQAAAQQQAQQHQAQAQQHQHQHAAAQQAQQQQAQNQQDQDGPAFDTSDFPSLGGALRQQQPGGRGIGADGLGQLGGGLGGGLQGTPDLLAALGVRKPGGLGGNVGGGGPEAFTMQKEDFPALPGAPTHRDVDALGRNIGGGNIGAFGSAFAAVNSAGAGRAGNLSLGGSALTANADVGLLGGGGGGNGLGGAAAGDGGMARAGTAADYDQQLLRYQMAQQMQAQAAAGGRPLLQGGGGAGNGLGGNLLGGLAAGSAAAAGGAAGGILKAPGDAAGKSPDRFGLLGLLPLIKMTDADLTMLALGTDLTSLGLNLNSAENLHRTFVSPMADTPVRPEPVFELPACYSFSPQRLMPGYLSKFKEETLFYMFYSMPSDEAQLIAADELSQRGWWFHRRYKVWMLHAQNSAVQKSERGERGSFVVFDITVWEMVTKSDIEILYEDIEQPPRLPRPKHMQTGAGGGPVFGGGPAGNAGGGGGGPGGAPLGGGPPNGTGLGQTAPAMQNGPLRQ